MFYHFTQTPIDNSLMFDINQSLNVIIEADDKDSALDRIFKLRFRNDQCKQQGYRQDDYIEITTPDIFLYCQNIADTFNECNHPPVILHLEDCPPIPFYKHGSLIGMAGVEGVEGNGTINT